VAATAPRKPARRARNCAAAEKRSKLAPLKRRIDEFDKSIAKPSRKIADIDAAPADPKLYDRDPARVTTLGKERAEAVSALAAEDQWLALSSDYDSATAEG
jgi:ATP-binding cassette, subfamily F, member 3